MHLSSRHTRPVKSKSKSHKQCDSRNRLPEESPIPAQREINHLQELLGGRDEAGVAYDRLEDHAGDLALVGGKQLPDRVEVVVGGSERGGSDVRGHT